MRGSEIDLRGWIRADPSKSHTFGKLESSFLSYLEVGGSHAHKLEPLVQRLGIPTLVITDLDPGTPTGASNKVKAQPTHQATTTMNPALRHWFFGADGAVAEAPEPDNGEDAVIVEDVTGDVENQNHLQALLELTPGEKLRPPNLRVAYQVAGTNGTCGSSFEDALALENVEFFKQITAKTGPLATFRKDMQETNSPSDLATRLYESLRKKSFDKGAFATHLLEQASQEGAAELVCPHYIAEGLVWLAMQMKPSALQEVATAAAVTP